MSDEPNKLTEHRTESELRTMVEQLQSGYTYLQHEIAGKTQQVLEAKLVHRHIIGKVYEVSAESINRLAGELDEVKEENDHLREALEGGNNG